MWEERKESINISEENQISKRKKMTGYICRVYRRRKRQGGRRNVNIKRKKVSKYGEEYK